MMMLLDLCLMQLKMQMGDACEIRMFVRRETKMGSCVVLRRKNNLTDAWV